MTEKEIRNDEREYWLRAIKAQRELFSDPNGLARWTESALSVFDRIESMLAAGRTTSQVCQIRGCSNCEYMRNMIGDQPCSSCTHRFDDAVYATDTDNWVSRKER